MKNGLSYFDDGGLVSEPEEKLTEFTTAPPTGAAAKKIPLGPTQTADLLANMQAMIDRRESPMAIFNRGLERASAWGSGGLQGPSAALNQLNQREQNEEKSTFDMRQQMAAYRAAQAQQEADAKAVSGFMGGAPMGGFSYADLPPASKARVYMASPSQKRAVLDAELKMLSAEQTKGDYNPAALDRNKEALIRNPRTGQIELREVNSLEYRDLQAKGLIVPASEMYGVGAKPAAPAAGTAPAAVGSPTITPADIRRVESGGNPAAVSSKGAEGTMQVMPATQKDPGFGVKPAANKSPEELERTGVDYFAAMKRVYGDDVTAAIAYNMGPGATDKWIKEGKKFDQLPAETQDYVKKLTAGKAPAATTAPGIPDIAKIKADRKIQEARNVSAAEASGKTSEELRKTFLAETNPDNVSQEVVEAKRVQDIVKNNPTIAGVLQAPGMGPAIAKVLEGGVGTFGIKEIQDAIYLTLPTTTRKALGERNELITYLARIELKAAKLIKGQGQITEGEREILKRASSDIRDPAEAIYKKAKMIEALGRKNEEMRKIYSNAPLKDKTDFETFRETNPEIRKLDVIYRAELNNIVNENVDFSKQRAAAGAKKVQHPADIQAIINKGKPK
jgi:soluble lytic murein transglycosylase-like protein